MIRICTPSAELLQVVGVHLWAIRQDRRYPPPAEALLVPAAPLSEADKRVMLEAQIAQLEQQLAAVRAELEELENA